MPTSAPTVIRGVPGPAAPAMRYVIAGLFFDSSLGLPALPSCGASPRLVSAEMPALLAAGAFPERVFAGPASIGDELLEIECHTGEVGDRLCVPGRCEAQISADGSAVLVEPSTPQPPAPWLESFLCGPVMVLALARRGVFCLHASAVRGPLGALLLVGQSGAGKSTLARYLGARPGVLRLTDDVTPVDVAWPRPCALPHFPQLKLPPGAQWPRGAAVRLPIGAVCLLDATRSAAAVRPLTGAAAVARLVHHVVGLPLLPPGSRQAALEVCATLSLRASVLDVAYPHTAGALEATLRSLAERALVPSAPGGEPTTHPPARPPVRYPSGGRHATPAFS